MVNCNGFAIMIKLLKPLPKKLTVAFSGGVDSVAVVDFLRRKHEVTCAFFHHGTETSNQANLFVTEFSKTYSLDLITQKIDKEKPAAESYEEFWRNQRYSFLESIPGTVVTAHHLDDCIETYIYGCLHGTPKVIPYSRNNIVRPFLTTRKQEFYTWCLKNNLEWCEDKTNTDRKYMRNFIRNEIVERAFYVNPGLDKVVKKIVLKNIEPKV